MIDPAAAWVVDAQRLASRSAQLAVGRVEADRQGPPHGPPTASRPCGTASPADERLVTERALLVLADGTTFEGVAVGHRPTRRRRRRARSCSTPRSSGYQEIVTDPSYAGQIITFTYPHIGNYGVNGDDDEARAPHCRGVIVRDLARRASNWRATEDLDGLPRTAPRSPAIAGDRHPPADPSHPRTRVRCPARSVSPTATRCSPPRRPTAAPTAGPRRRRHAPRSPTPSGPTDARVLRRRVRLRHQALDRRPARRRPAARSRSCPRRRRVPTCSGASPTACSSRTVPAIPPRSPTRAENVRGLLGKVPGVRHLPRAPDHGPRARRAARSSCSSVITAATIPCATSRPARSRSRVRTTTTRSTPTRCPTARWCRT